MMRVALSLSSRELSEEFTSGAADHSRQRTRGSARGVLFSRDGEPLRDFRFVWDRACDKIRKPGAMFHDLRRTGVRNPVRAGVSTTVAIAISGHKADSIFRRYNITSENDLTSARPQNSERTLRQNGQRGGLDDVVPKLSQNRTWSLSGGRIYF